MKKFKKVFAVILSLALILGMSITAFAEEGVAMIPLAPANSAKSISPYPQSTDKVTVKITGLTGGPIVKLYQIASAKYGEEGRNGLIEYKWNDELGIDFKAATSGQIANIANSLVSNEAEIYHFATLGENEKEYSTEVEAGVYIAVITGAEDGSVYNPILLTATYSRTENAEGDVDGTLLIGGSINAADARYLNGVNAVAKKSTPSINKTITGGATSDNTIPSNTLPEGTNEASTPGPTRNATASVGDSLEYTITPELPSYPAEAINKTLAITDRTNKGLTFQFDTLSMVLDGSVTVNKSLPNEDGIVTFSIDGKEIAYAKSFSMEQEDKTVITGFDMTFKYDNLIHGAQGAVYVPTIKYNAVVNDDAVVGSDGNTNTTTLYYTNQPNTGSKWDPASGNVPEGEDIEEKTDKETFYTYQLAFHKTGEGNESDGLAGAVFGIYSDSSCTADKLVDVVTTDINGYAVSSKVGAGTYYIKEITAPDGYSLNVDVFEVVANWTTAKTVLKDTTVTKREYTTTEPTTGNKEQVGWLMKDKDTGVFYDMNTSETFVTDNGLLPAYLKSQTTTVTTLDPNDPTAIVFLETNSGAGTVAELKNIRTNEEGNTIPNTKLTSLPSTGGIGTTIFTIGGCAIMIIAAALFFASRRKSAK